MAPATTWVPKVHLDLASILAGSLHLPIRSSVEFCISQTSAALTLCLASLAPQQVKVQRQAASRKFHIMSWIPPTRLCTDQGLLLLPKSNADSPSDGNTFDKIVDSSSSLSPGLLDCAFAVCTTHTLQPPIAIREVDFVF
ncbi:unnamed protein product [Cercospora beticola]|nr:unnamed protein product [Cercospora beticola]